MRVALDARYLNGQGSGIGSYTFNLARSLLAADEDLELLLVRGRAGDRPLIADPRVSEITFPFPANSPATQYLLGPFLRAQRFDLFHSPFDTSPRGLRRPLVVTIHDINWMVNPRLNSHNPLVRQVLAAFYQHSLRSSMAQAQRILADSQATRHAIEEHEPWFNAKVRVVPLGIDRHRVFPLERATAWRTVQPVLEEGTPFVLTVGSAIPLKNHVNAVRGFLAAFGDRPDYRMVLVRRFVRGDPALRRLLRTTEVRDRVVLLPHVSDELLNALYNTARILLHPSYYEGFGIPLVEAMMARLPIVTSHLSSMQEVVGPAALLVDPADPQSIALALTRLDQDESLRQQLIAAGAERLDLFDWDRCARATLAVYRELV
jgi:glycosyltransferase involved in cell wall biosynthesis